MDIRLPNINSATESGQLAQIRSYLYQLAGELNWAIRNIEAGTSGNGTAAAGAMTGAAPSTTAENTFNSIKSLIIKSADIVEAFYSQINKRLEGQYVAQSEFGTFSEQTANDITANSTAIEQMYTDIQKIFDTVDGIEESVISASAYIKSGLLEYADDGAPVYGLEIGQRNEIDGEETFDKFARFTSDRLSFYDRNDIEVAYISDYKLFITHAEITGTLTHGKFMWDATNGLALKWIGG